MGFVLDVLQLRSSGKRKVSWLNTVRYWTVLDTFTIISFVEYRQEFPRESANLRQENAPKEEEETIMITLLAKGVRKNIACNNSVFLFLYIYMFRWSAQDHRV